MQKKQLKRKYKKPVIESNNIGKALFNKERLLKDVEEFNLLAATSVTSDDY